MFSSTYSIIGSFFIAWILTWVVRVWALRLRLLDVPNQRSSHAVPTPRGGGLAVVFAASVALIYEAYSARIGVELLAALGGGGGAIAIIGLIDDRRPVRPAVRLFVHLLAASWSVYWLGGLPPLALGAGPMDFGIFGSALAVLGIAAATNFFNFMDGIDGIAASEAVVVCFAGALLACFAGPLNDSAIAAWIVGAASLGFMLWNWPPAKIFMGDVGSGYLGFAIAVLSLASARTQPAAVLIWLMLCGVFFTDTLVTLIRRVLRREPVHQAHRSHAYQRMARRWNSHGRVTLLSIGINLLWLLPCASIAALWPQIAGWMVLLALLPIAIAVWLAGVGGAEDA